jgi:choline dehydrogenase-like flavoprotein
MQNSFEVSKQFDFIVCGSGSSGSVVAGRLAANPNISVLLIEAGGSDETELVLDTDRWPINLGSALDWGFITEPSPNLNGRSILYSMGKVLGGGSSINVGTWSRGHQADWDLYAAETADPNWRYDAILELYRRRVEDWTGVPDPDFYGVGRSDARATGSAGFVLSVDARCRGIVWTEAIRKLRWSDDAVMRRMRRCRQHYSRWKTAVCLPLLHLPAAEAAESHRPDGRADNKYSL